MIVFKVECPVTVNLSQHGLSASGGIVEVVNDSVVDCVVDTTACVVDGEVDGVVDGAAEDVVDCVTVGVVDCVTVGVEVGAGDGVVEIVVDVVEVMSVEVHSKIKSVAIHLPLKHIQLNSDGLTRQVFISASA